MSGGGYGLGFEMGCFTRYCMGKTIACPNTFGHTMYIFDIGMFERPSLDSINSK